MKRYKLLKDIPTLKAGTIFEEVVGDFDGLRALTRITPVGAKTSPHFTIKDIDNFDDWFEEIPEKYERWRGEKSEKYWFIDSYGEPDYDDEYGLDANNNLYAMGNYFKTKKEAEAYKEYLIARQTLLDDAEGGKFVLIGKNLSGDYNDFYRVWNIHSNNLYCPGVVYFQDEDAFRKSLKEHEEQWKTVRKYEMGEM